MQLPRIKNRHIAIVGAASSLIMSGVLVNNAFSSIRDIAVTEELRQDTPGIAVNVATIPQQNAPFLFLGALGCIAGVVSLTQLKDDSGNLLIDMETLEQDIPDTVVAVGLHLAAWIGGAFSDLGNWGGDRVTEILRIVIKSAPPAIKSLSDRLMADDSIFQEFLSAPHNRIAGRTRSGKYFITGKLIVEYFAKYGTAARIAIADINYGKPGDDGELSDWMGLPHEYIATTLEQITELISAEHSEMMARKDLCAKAAAAKRALTTQEKTRVLEPRLLILDEIDSTLGQLPDEITDKLNQLICMGGGANSGYRMKIVIVGQSLSVGASGIDLATTDQLATCLVVKGKFNSEQVGKLKDSSEAIDNFKRLLNSGKRAALIQIGGELRAVAVPDLSYLNQVRFEVEGVESDPVKRWWFDTYQGELQAWLAERATLQNSGQLTTPLKDIATKFGVQTRSNDQRYSQYLKPEWARLTNSSNKDSNDNE